MRRESLREEGRLREPAFLGLLAAALVLALADAASAQAEPAAPARAKTLSAEDVALFEKDVLPILQANCFKCHTGDKVKGDLSLASRAGLLKGGELGPAVSLQ